MVVKLKVLETPWPQPAVRTLPLRRKRGGGGVAGAGREGDAVDDCQVREQLVPMRTRAVRVGEKRKTCATGRYGRLDRGAGF